MSYILQLYREGIAQQIRIPVQSITGNSFSVYPPNNKVWIITYIRMKNVSGGASNMSVKLMSRDDKEIGYLGYIGSIADTGEIRFPVDDSNGHKRQGMFDLPILIDGTKGDYVLLVWSNTQTSGEAMLTVWELDKGA